MDDQALLEGIVVFSDEDGPGKHKEEVGLVSGCACFYIMTGSVALNRILHRICPDV